MKNNTTKQLYVIVYHVPGNFVSAGHPVVLVNGFVSFDAYEIFGSSQMTVEISSSNHNFFVFGKSSGSIFHDGKSYRQYIIEGFFVDIQYLFLDFVNLCKECFAVLQFSRLNTGFQFIYFGPLLGCRIADVGLQFFCFGAQAIIVELGYFRIGSFDFVHPRLYFFHVACGLIAKDRA
ncbi:unknown [Bacteroides sp. CAG:633]|nr:unknown [Bacteroides sp. CAG:633]